MPSWLSWKNVCLCRKLCDDQCYCEAGQPAMSKALSFIVMSCTMGHLRFWHNTYSVNCINIVLTQTQARKQVFYSSRARWQWSPVQEVEVLFFIFMIGNTPVQLNVIMGACQFASIPSYVIVQTSKGNNYWCETFYSIFLHSITEETESTWDNDMSLLVINK